MALKKLHVMMLGYHPPETIKEALKVFDKIENKYEIASKTFVDARYPGNDADLMYSLSEIMRGWNYVRPAKNYGVAGNWNWTLRELDLKEGDVLFGMDPDGRPQTPGYLDAIMDIMNNAPECYTVQLNRPCVYSQNRPHFERVIGSTTVLDYQELVAWSLGAFDCGWLRKIGGLKQGHPLYGYTEHATVAALQPLGGKWLIAKDFYDIHLKSSDDRYTAWKLACATHETNLPFDKWLDQCKA